MDGLQTQLERLKERRNNLEEELNGVNGSIHNIELALYQQQHKADVAEMWRTHPGLELSPGDLLDSSGYLREDAMGRKPLVLEVDSIQPADTSFIVKTWYDPKLEFLHSMNKPPYWSGVVTLVEARKMREAYLATASTNPQTFD